MNYPKRHYLYFNEVNIMSGQTELERNLRRLKNRYDVVVAWWRTYILPLFKLREIRGVLIGQHFGPLAGARVTLNGWRTVKTDRRGMFCFRFVLRPVSSLTVEWHEAELSDWIEVKASRQVTELKLKWPLLIRGQVVNPQGAPISQMLVMLNRNIVTHTDAHGTFIFPQSQLTTSPSDQLLFQWEGQSYVHHFKSNPQDHLLHRFMLDHDEGLYHLEDRPAAQALSPNLNRFARRVKIALISALILVALLFVALTLWYGDPQHKLTLAIHSDAPVSFTRAGALERNLDHDPTSTRDARPPMWDEVSNDSSGDTPQSDSSGPRPAIAQSEGEDEPLEEPAPCQEMEFTYNGYIVPRGMEGILLSLVFGRWQSWRDELSVFNRLDRHHQLQAGQRIKLKLPLLSWSMYQHQDAQSWRQILQESGCDEDALKLCKQLVQAWNPHLSIRRLRRGDMLLMNVDLLRTRPFEGTTLSRIEKLRRSPQRRRRRPRLKLASNCSLVAPLSDTPQ